MRIITTKQFHQLRRRSEEDNSDRGLFASVLLAIIEHIIERLQEIVAAQSAVIGWYNNFRESQCYGVEPDLDTLMMQLKAAEAAKARP